MERVLETVILSDGLPLDICQRFEEVGDMATGQPFEVPGLKLCRVAGGTITAPEAHALLKHAGRTDVIERFAIPAY